MIASFHQYFLATILICTVHMMPAMAQIIWYVDDDAPNDPGPGESLISDPLEDGSLAHPFDAITEGIDAASGGDTVLVVDGTYTGDGNRDIDFNGKVITVKSENGAENCVIDCEGNETEFHRAFHFHNCEDVDSVVRGFTIQNGYIDVPAEYGGAIWCDNSSSPSIIGNIFTLNSAHEGGGIACTNQSEPLISDNTFNHNSTHGITGDGGGIHCNYSSPTNNNNIITWNFARGRGGGVYCYESSPTITHNSITYNEARTGSGGGIYCYANSNAVIDDNLIQGNWTNTSSSSGGGILCSFASPTITNNIIVDNNSRDRGGGIYCGSSNSIIGNNLISGNIAAEGGGGVYCIASSGLYTPIMTSNTIVDNIAEDVGAGGFESYGDGLDAVISNSIICDNSPYEIIAYWNSLTVSYSNISGGYPGIGNIDADPLFVSGPLGDYYLSQITAGQSEDSPCLNTGSHPSEQICFTVPDGTYCINQLTTRTDLFTDTGQVDIGYHDPTLLDLNVISTELTCQPLSETLPFALQIGVSLTNNRSDCGRRFDAVLGVQSAGGLEIPGWKKGRITLGPENIFITSFNQMIPAIKHAIGINTFIFKVEDITPPPYNQPPYPPSGDMDTSDCLVEGIAP